MQSTDSKRSYWIVPQSLLLIITISTSCRSDSTLIKHASSAYQWQKSEYKRLCRPPKDKPNGCKDLEAQLSLDYRQIIAAIDAVEVSKGGSLPKAARAKLRAIRKDLEK